MEAYIAGIGAWGPGFCTLAQYQDMLRSGSDLPIEDVTPKPERIPSRERRRAPALVKLAVEVADQACRMANIEPANAQSVFTSGIGDTDITDYMCRVLAGPEKLLSPTKFHNSVHNAAAGVWSISTDCQKPATFVSSMRNSFSMALVEALVQITSDKVPVLLTLSDISMPAALRQMHPIERMFGMAMLLTPTTTPQSDDGINRLLSLELQPELAGDSPDWPALNYHQLNGLYQSSPSAKALCLMEALSTEEERELQLPVSDQLVCTLKLGASKAMLPKLSRLGS